MLSHHTAIMAVPCNGRGKVDKPSTVAEFPCASLSRLISAPLHRYGHTAIIAMDAAALRRVRGKTRVLLTRFLARALLCPVFSQEWVDHRPKGVLLTHQVLFA